MLSLGNLFGWRQCIGAIALVWVLVSPAKAAFMDRVLVIVNEDVITQAEFDYRLQSVVADFQSKQQPVPADLPKQLLDGMISDRLQVQEAENRGISIDEQELQSALELFASQRELTVEQLRASIEASNQPFEMFEASVRDSIIIQRFTEFYAQRRVCLLYTSPSPRDLSTSRMPSSA